ncbi:MAG: glycoside hydrolase family 127 protein [Verrucomicrobia subdivision 3 bacterium]|nr:glycoside hydrolase family 127 protein [Limisphaerales bacterium]
MRAITWTCLLASTLVATAADYPLKPVPFHEVDMTSAFWRPRLETQRTVLVPFAFGKTEPGVAHLQAAADALTGKKTDDHRPHRFIDSDLYKVMEGAAYLVKLRDDPKLEAKFDAIVDVIAGAQEPNGYLYPSHTTGVGAKKHMMGDKPYEFVVHSHELYNMGHMYEAAIAYYQATGKDKLLKVAEKNAQHVNKVFFEGDPKYNGGKPIRQAPGHQEMELALVKLYRVTGKQLYLDMARKFLEIRGITYVPDGEGVMSPTYAQQHRPVAKQTKAVGHAVRATYLYSGMADVGVLAGKTAYAKALDQIWANITDTRMHITGGLGAVHGIEGFGPEYELPNADAFNETCAAVGNVLFNYRMFLLHKDAKYLDVAEVALLNNVLAAVNLAGNRFFYVNPLAADGKYPFNHGTAGRAPWFGTACCPSNMARLLPQVQGMTYAHDGENLYVTFFAESATTVKIGNAEVAIRQATAYPNDGKIRINLDPTKPVDFALRLRIPTWTGKQFVPGKLYQYANAEPAAWTLKVNGKPVEAKVEKGFAVIDRTWKRGDRVELNLPMPVRLNTCHPNVEANHDRVALTRGPFVLCAEGVDNGGVTERYFFEKLPKLAGAPVKTRSIESGSFIQTTVPASALTATGGTKSQPLVLTPYYAWNNRGPSSMTVWFPRNKAMAVYDPLALPKESVFKAITATHTSPLDTVNAIGDGLEPRWSSGNKVPRWTSRGQEGKPQTVTASFHGPKKIRSIGVYWMDHYQHPVKFPKEWKIETLHGGQWKPFELYTTDRYDTRANQFNVVHPAAPLTCDAIRIHMTPRDQTAMGILEMKVVFEK